MNCPHCSQEMLCTHTSGDGDKLYACEHCDLRAAVSPKPVHAGWLEDRIADLEAQLEAERDRRIEAERELERLTSPAAVLEAAERLLREANVADVFLREGKLYTRDDRTAHGASGTLAEAYEKLTKGGGHG